jgi:hypothetical protein
MAADLLLYGQQKRNSIQRRLVHTLTGCRVYPGRTPWYAVALRAALWAVPGVVGVSCSVAWRGVGGASLGGGLVFLYSAYVHCLAILLRVMWAMFFFSEKIAH